MSVQDRIDKNYENGRNFKEHIQNTKRDTGGEIFLNSPSRLGKTILYVQRERKEDARVKREGTYKKDILEYREKKQQIKEILTVLA